MSVILALDVGEKSIGIAFSDDSETFAFPGETLFRHEGHRKDMAILRNLIKDRSVSEIVIGNPYLMDGTAGIQSQKMESFAELMSNHTDLPIHLHDERLSTWEAEQALIELGQSRIERKRTIDSLAAAAILQSFLDSRKKLK